MEVDLAELKKQIFERHLIIGSEDHVLSDGRHGALIQKTKPSVLTQQVSSMSWLYKGFVTSAIGPLSPQSVLKLDSSKSCGFAVRGFSDSLFDFGMHSSPID